MQNICLLFAGRRGVDDPVTRTSVLRIPEVSRKLKEAQALLDEVLMPQSQVDLNSYLQSVDADFNSNPSLKSLVAAVIQIGLFDRYVKYRSHPQFLVGRTNGCSSMRVCAGLQSFEDFVQKSDFCKENSTIAHLAPQNTRLSGVKLEDYGAMMWDPEGFYYALNFKQQEAGKIIAELSEKHLLTQCIHVGPCYDFRLAEFDKSGLYGIASMSSIDLDPILNSFWKAAI